MFGTTITVKFQNKLARETILDRLKSKSKYMFEDGGSVSRVTGQCKVEYSDKMNLENFIKIK